MRYDRLNFIFINDTAMIAGVIRAPIKERAGASVSNSDLVPMHQEVELEGDLS